MFSKAVHKVGKTIAKNAPIAKSGKKIGKFFDSALGNVTGSRDRAKANAIAQQSLDDSRRERDEYKAESDRIDSEKLASKKRAAKKSTRAARRSSRRPGFLNEDASGEVSDLLG